MNITLLGHLHGYGGAEKSLILLANQLSQRGHSVTLVTVTANNNVYQLDEGVKCNYIPDIGANKLGVIAHRYLELKRYFAKQHTDLVISFWFQIGIMSMILSKFHGFKIIYSERGDPADIEYDGLNGIIRTLSFPFFDGFVFQTKGARDFFNKKMRQKSCIIHNAINIDEGKIGAVPQKKKYIIGIGRLHRQKNFQLLIKAFAKIQKDYHDYFLVIYGEGEQRDELQTLISQLAMDKKVILFGNTSEIMQKLLEAEIFVLSSDFEGMPNALMEAMALGLPCISTDCTPGGAAELIDNHKNGVLVEKNNVNALAEAMRLLLDNPDVAQQYGNAAKKIRETHSLDKIYDKWNDYLKRLCE